MSTRPYLPDKVSDAAGLGEIAAATAILKVLFPLDLTGCDPCRAANSVINVFFQIRNGSRRPVLELRKGMP